MKLLNALVGVVLLLFSVSCSVLPTQKHDAAATKAADSIATQQSLSVEKITDITPPQWVMPQGWSDYSPPATTAGKPSVSKTPQPVTSSPTAASPVPVLIPSQYHSEVKVNSRNGQNAGTTTTNLADEKSTIPAGVKLALLAVGLFLLFIVVVLIVKYVRNNSAAARAAIDAADSRIADGIQSADAALKQQIDKLRTRIASTTDPVQQATHNADIAQLEAERGKLATKAAAS